MASDESRALMHLPNRTVADYRYRCHQEAPSNPPPVTINVSECTSQYWCIKCHKHSPRCECLHCVCVCSARVCLCYLYTVWAHDL
jgi:hypothetical protein